MAEGKRGIVVLILSMLPLNYFSYMCNEGRPKRRQTLWAHWYCVYKNSSIYIKSVFISLHVCMSHTNFEHRSKC